MNKVRLVLAGAASAFASAAAAAETGAPAGDANASAATIILDKIVVTAQRRKEDLQNVPVTVTVATNERISASNIHDLGGLTQVIPGLKVDYTASWVQPSIRGIGSANAGPGVSSPVATYVDGYYVPSPNPSGFNFADVSSIQVLAGPQGTLFGRNATAGALLITTRDPSNKLRFDADVGYGRWNTVQGNIFLAGPLSEDVGMSLSASGKQTDGFVRNVITGGDANEAKNYSLRGKLRIYPTMRSRLTLGAEYSYLSDPRTTIYSPYKGRSLGVLFFGAPSVSERGDFASYGFTRAVSKSYAFNMSGELDLDFATLKSFSQYRHDQIHNVLNYDGSAAALAYLDYLVTEKTLSQEFNLSSNPGGKLSWVAGLFLYRNKGDVPLSMGSPGPNPAYGFFYYGYQKTTTVAPYADLTYQFGDLYLTGGVRYSVDTAQKDYVDFAHRLFSTPKVTFKQWTPRAIARYEFSDQANAYVSFSKGTKAGLYNPNSSDPQAVNPEKLTAYEIGAKFSLVDWQAELSTFYYDYKDLQVATYDNAVTFVRNAGKVEVYGGQLHVAGLLTDSLKLDAGVAYTHGIYKEFTGVTIYEWDPMFGIVQRAGDVSGRPIQRSPKLTGNVGLTYKAEVIGGNLSLNTNLAFQSKFYFDPNGVTEQRGYALLSASAAYTPPNSRFTFSVVGTNLTNTNYRIATLGSPLGFGQIYGEPASFLFRLAYKY